MTSLVVSLLLTIRQLFSMSYVRAFPIFLFRYSNILQTTSFLKEKSSRFLSAADILLSNNANSWLSVSSFVYNSYSASESSNISYKLMILCVVDIF
ncbi:hypothetical protein ECANGB1_2666 [Enterospora canceri]|uniref:Secreted protein n=1 Tax=Enterospora canceri TaxID=1081671 RepID=A0A1Y1S5B3_9MICR|nr:hypothetical protein ECANGB1_2666 [Enterospora canceri]